MRSQLITIIILFIELHGVINEESFDEYFEGVVESTSEKRLRKELFITRNYDKYSFPVKDHNKAVNVSVYVGLYKVIDLVCDDAITMLTLPYTSFVNFQDIKTEVLTLNGFLHTYWIDEHLSWNESDFDGRQNLTVPADMIWTPDIAVINGPLVFRFDKYKSRRFRIFSNGRVRATFRAHFQSYCHTDVTAFPEDEHYCNLYWESFFEYKYVDLTNWNENITRYSSKRIWKQNAEWDVTKVATGKKVISWKKSYASVWLDMTLKRRPTFLYHLITVPNTIAIVLSLVAMTYPPNSYKRYKASGLSLILLFLELLFIIFKIGFVGNKGVPKIVVNTSTTIVFVSVNTFLAIVTHRLSHNRRQLPNAVTALLANPWLKFAGVGHYLIGLSVEEGVESGLTVSSDCGQMTDTKTQWLVLTLLLDKICALAYILYLLSVYL